MSEIRAYPAKWRAIALVCRKCTKKLGGGFGKKNKHGLADVVQEALKASGRRRAVRMVEVGCLDICPKRAVTMALAGRVLTVPEGTAPETIIAAMDLPAAAAPGTTPPPATGP